MNRSIYIINPASTPYYYSVDYFKDVFGQPIIPFAELSITTVAALAPADFQVRLCDEHLQDVDMNPPEKYIALTGKTNQFGRVLSLVRHFRSLGKVVIAGGPYASLASEEFANEVDIIVRGELEEIAEEFFADLRAGTYKNLYEGPKADLRKSPVPRWDLYPNHQALSGTLQTSRGCPFSCEFCDVIQYAGRKQRHKDVPQILKELDILSDTGYRSVFLTDDNFTATRSRAKEILDAFARWNSERPQDRMMFLTQLSLDAANDEELLIKASRAGLARAFVGVETFNIESLKETRKLQNLQGDIKGRLYQLLEYGIAVYGGIIFGFDNDSVDIFKTQLEFLNESPLGGFSGAALIAYRSTPLYRRLVPEGRVDMLRGDAMFAPWETNISFKQMDKLQFETEFLRFIKDAFSPGAFEKRMINAIKVYGRQTPWIFEYQFTQNQREVSKRSFRMLLKMIRELGDAEEKMLRNILKACDDSPLKMLVFTHYIYSYVQLRYLFSDLFGDTDKFTGVPLQRVMDEARSTYMENRR